MTEACSLDSCTYFDRKARLNCRHLEIGPQDLRPKKPDECRGFKPELVVIQREGKYIIGCLYNNKEVEYERSSSDSPEAAEEKAVNAANGLNVRVKDIVIAALKIPTFPDSLQQENTARIRPAVNLDSPDAKLSQADKLVLLCTQQHPTLFCDQTGTPYARVEWQGVYRTMSLRSRHFRAWLANLLWLSEQKVPGTQAVYAALNVLAAMANSNTPYILYNRVAPGEDCFWIDMCDEKWRAIKVSADGWEIVEDPPVLFKRYSHQLPMVEPKHGGDPWKLLAFINVAEDDEDSRLILVCLPVSYLIPEIPHPILCVYGHQGAAKSWMFRFIRRIVDPSRTELLPIPWDEKERIQQLDHHWCAFYDNISSLSRQVSDSLCRAVTGGGFTQRELYSDDDDVIRDFMRCVALNGINLPAQYADLLDRCVLILVRDIPNDRRKTEQQLVSEFDACKAEILGGLLDTLVKAMELYPSVNPKDLFRMADFTRWGCAIAIALGKTEEDFIRVYSDKVSTQIKEAAYASPVATVLLDFLETCVTAKNPTWKGAPAELFTILFDHAAALKISTHQKAWPKAPNILSQKLNDLALSLKALGWEIVISKSRGIRTITINSVPSDQHTDKGDDEDAGGGSRPVSSMSLAEKLENIKTWLLATKDKEDMIDASVFSEKCRQLGLDTHKIVQILIDEFWLHEVPKIGKWGVR